MSVRIKKALAVLFTSSMIAVIGVAPAGAQRQAGLVNVAVGDVSILDHTNIAVAAQVAATLCGITVPVAVLAQQVVAGRGTFTCDTATGPLTVRQSQ
jgi:hypothetical protein